MITPVSNNFNDACFSPSRNVDLEVKVGNTDISDYIINARVIENLNGESMTFGDTCSKQCEMKMYLPSGIVVDNMSFTLRIGIYVDGAYEYIPMGTYIVSSYSTDDNYETVDIVAFDKMAFLTDTYTGSTSDLISDVINGICTTYGITLKSGQTFPTVNLGFILDGTQVRDLLGYIAAYMGACVRIDRNNELEFIFYTQAQMDIDDEVIYLNGLENTNQNEYIINALSCDTYSEVLKSGDGRAMEFVCPYMTQAQLDNLLLSVDNTRYYAGEVSFRGNPCIEVGDIVTVNDVAFPVMEQEFEFSQGLKVTISSFGLSDNGLVLSRNNTLRKVLSRQKTLLETEFEAVTETMKGNLGGYWELMYQNDVPIGWKIISNNDPNMWWQFTNGGLAHTRDGGVTFSDAAIDLNGNIVANAITTGTMSADRIALGSETLGTYLRIEADGLVIGNQESQMKLVQKADSIQFQDSNGNVLASFTSTGLEFQTLKQIKLGNFLIQARNNGNNLSFLKQ